MKTLEYASIGEARVARKLVSEILDRGYFVNVFDGEEITIRRCDSAARIIGALGTTREDTITAIIPGSGRKLNFLLVWGNDASGDELIADCTDTELAIEICEAAYGREPTKRSIIRIR